MAVLSTTNPTLADFAARLDGNDKVVADIVEILGEENEVLQDMTFIEANEYTSHRTTVRSGLPQGASAILSPALAIASLTVGANLLIDALKPGGGH